MTDPRDAEIARLREDRDKFEAALGRACQVGGTTYLVERAEKAEAERDAALAQVAGAYEAAAEIADALRAGGHEVTGTAIRRSTGSAVTNAALSRRDAQMRAEGMRMAAETLTRWLGYARIGNSDYVRGQEEAVIFNRDAILAAAEKEAQG